MGTPQVAAMKATGVHTTVAGTLHLFLLALPVFTSVRFTPEGHSCCQFVVVEDAAGEYVGLNGNYILKVDTAGDLPDPICLDGCVYTKQGAPTEEEYCFREETTSGANVEQNSYPALPSTALTGTSTPSATSIGTTAQASLESIQSHIDEALGKVSQHKDRLNSLLQDSSLTQSVVQALNQILTSLENMGTLMESIGSLTSGRLRRAAIEDCVWMVNAKQYFEDINKAINDALEAMNEVYPTAVSDLDALLLEMKDYYEQLRTTHRGIIGSLGSTISEVCPDIATTDSATPTGSFVTDFTATIEARTSTATASSIPVTAQTTQAAPTPAASPSTAAVTMSSAAETTTGVTTSAATATSAAAPTSTTAPTTAPTTTAPTTTAPPTSAEMTTMIGSTSTAAATTASPSAPPTTALPTSKAAITSTTAPPMTAGPATTTTVVSTTTFSPPTTPASTTADDASADDASSSAPISSLKDETQKNIDDVTSILEEENIDPESEIGKNLTLLLNLLQGLSSGLDSIGGSSSRQKRDIKCAWVNGIIRQYNSLLEASPLLQSHGFKQTKMAC